MSPVQHGQPDCGDPRSAERRSRATGGEGAGGAAGKERGRGREEEEEREAKSQSSPAVPTSGECGLSPEQVAPGALILSRGLAERSVAYGGGKAEI